MKTVGVAMVSAMCGAVGALWVSQQDPVAWWSYGLRVANVAPATGSTTQSGNFDPFVWADDRAWLLVDRPSDDAVTSSREPGFDDQFSLEPGSFVINDRRSVPDGADAVDEIHAFSDHSDFWTADRLDTAVDSQRHSTDPVADQADTSDSSNSVAEAAAEARATTAAGSAPTEAVLFESLFDPPAAVDEPRSDSPAARRDTDGTSPPAGDATSLRGPSPSWSGRSSTHISTMATTVRPQPLSFAEAMPSVRLVSSGKSVVETAQGGPRRTAKPAAPAAAKPVVTIGSRTESGWTVIARSAGGHPIHTQSFGSNGPITLFIAGLDGEDRIAVKWVDRLAQQLTDSPELVEGQRVVLLRAANPDGLVSKRPTNSRGVDLNRNFPTAGYRPLEHSLAGVGPASEPETQALLQTLAHWQPSRVVHLRSGSRPSQAVSNQPKDPVVSSLRSIAELSLEPLKAAAVPGSLEDYVATVLHQSVITLELQSGDDWRAAGTSHLPTLLIASGCHAPTSGADVASHPESPFKMVPDDESAEAAGTHGPVSAAAVVSARRKTGGYEELPPSPDLGL
jgi:hypothetical protein